MTFGKSLSIFITQVGHPDFRGGGNTVAHNISESFFERGHKVTAFYVSPRDLLNKPTSVSYKVRFIPQSKIPFVNCIKVALAISKNMRSENPDVIISLGYEGFFVANIKNKPLFVAASHNFIEPVSLRDFFKFKWLNPYSWGKFLYTTQIFLSKLTKQKADFVQVLCEFGRRQCESTYKIPGNKIFTIPNGVGIHKENARALDGKIVLFMGGSSPHKGLDILLKALPEVVKEFPTVEVRVLGEMKKEEGVLRFLAEKLGVASNIYWQGLVSPKEMSSFYKKSYVSVFPSRADTFPLGILESMSYGVPVLAARVGGIPEIIEDGISGILFTREDVSALAGALKELLRNPSLAASLGDQGRKIAETRFSWEKISEIFENEIYKRIA